MNIKTNYSQEFGTLTALLGIDRNSLLDYLNWCLLEHLVVDLAEDKEWLQLIKTDPKAIFLFKNKVEARTNYRWDTKNITRLYDRVRRTNEKHHRKKITYQELLRLLINAQLKCVECERKPPEVKLHIDHKLAASRGGNSEYENLQFLCQEHNLKKSDKLYKSELWLKLESLRPF